MLPRRSGILSVSGIICVCRSMMAIRRRSQRRRARKKENGGTFDEWIQPVDSFFTMQTCSALQKKTENGNEFAHRKFFGTGYTSRTSANSFAFRHTHDNYRSKTSKNKTEENKQ